MRDTLFLILGALLFICRIMTNPENTKQDLSHRTPFKVKLPGSEIVAIHNSLVADPGLRKKLPEEHFVTFFLPLFAGLETHPDINIGRWVSIAGTPFAEVDIINHHGQTLFTVPPIFERNVIDTTKVSEMSIQSITATYELLLQQSPYRAVKFLEHGLDKIDKTKDLMKWKGAHALKMKPIFERYNVIPRWEANNPKTASGSPAQSSPRPEVIDEEPL